jgi:hypothetical protein
MASLLDRYQAGEHTQVWNELSACGAAVREQPLLSDALAVARETMSRVRANMETLIQRLSAYGYLFDDRPVPRWKEPGPDVAERIAALEALVGPVPLSVRACYETIGAINFLGHHPAFERRGDDPWNALPDPLVVLPIASLIDDCRERLEDPNWDRARPLDLPLAPDILHKANVSGGPPYGVYVPDPSADALFRHEWHETTFVNYLRISLRWGGFPGLERYTTPPNEALSSLTAGLLPL